MLIDDVIFRIKFFLDYNHWTLYKLAQESDLSYSSLRNIFNRKTFPTLQTLEKICEGFNISMSEFFDYDMNPLRSSDMTEEEQQLLNTYRRLSIYKKALLCAYLEGLEK